MHRSALTYGKLFFETYASLFDEGTVLDVGSRNVNGSLKDICPTHLQYLGVDTVEGHGVDVISTDPYKLPFENESINIVISSSCFEHSELFWLLYLEIMRVLKPEGVFYLSAPNNGCIHRYPVDCWRFYPDAGRALVSWAEMNGFTPALLESFVGNQEGRVMEGEGWNDFVAVFVKEHANKNLYNDRILNKASQYTNGILNSTELLNPSQFSEDQTLFVKSESEIADLGQAVSERDNKINDLGKAVANRDDQIAKLVQAVVKRDEQINNLGRTLDERNAFISQMLESLSWRFTRPARIVKSFFVRKNSEDI